MQPQCRVESSKNGISKKSTAGRFPNIERTRQHICVVKKASLIPSVDDIRFHLLNGCTPTSHYLNSTFITNWSPEWRQSLNDKIYAKTIEGYNRKGTRTQESSMNANPIKALVSRIPRSIDRFVICATSTSEAFRCYRRGCFLSEKWRRNDPKANTAKL